MTLPMKNSKNKYFLKHILIPMPLKTDFYFSMFSMDNVTIICRRDQKVDRFFKSRKDAFQEVLVFCSTALLTSQQLPASLSHHLPMGKLPTHMVSYRWDCFNGPHFEKIIRKCKKSQVPTLSGKAFDSVCTKCLGVGKKQKMYDLIRA